MNNGFSRLMALSSALLLALQLTACGGGGGSGSGGSSPEEDDNDSGTGAETYTIGGSVTGAVNEGLTLKNNGADKLEVAGNSFEFATGLEDGEPYNVTLAGNPQHQLCSVANASGTVAGADVTDVDVSCRFWRSAELVEGNSGNAEAPQIAVDSDGNAIAVWEQHDGEQVSIFANTYSAADGSWGTATLLENSSAGDAADPQVAIDGDGNAIAAWSQFDGSYSSIYANTYSAVDGTWGSATLVESDPRNAQSPQIGINGGNAIVVWKQTQADSTGRVNIYASTYSGSDTWGERKLLENGDYGDATQPRIALDRNGNAIAVWSQYVWTESTHYTYCICASTYSADTGTWDERTFIDNVDGNAKLPSVAMDAQGNAVAVWHQDDVESGSRFSIYANTYSADSGSWGTASLIEGIDEGEADNPGLAVDRDGNAIVVWAQQRQDQPTTIYANAYADGSWGASAAPIEAVQTDTAFRPQVAFDPSGDALALWYQSDGQNFNVYANTYSSGTGAWGERVLIENNDGNAYGPQIGFDSESNAIGVWYQQGNTYTSIHANRFE